MPTDPPLDEVEPTTREWVETIRSCPRRSTVLKGFPGLLRRSMTPSLRAFIHALAYYKHGYMSLGHDKWFELQLGAFGDPKLTDHPHYLGDATRAIKLGESSAGDVFVIRLYPKQRVHFVCLDCDEGRITREHYSVESFLDDLLLEPDEDEDWE